MTVNIINKLNYGNRFLLEDALNVLILNLMPKKLETERQFTSWFSQTNENINLFFAIPDTHKLKNDVEFVSNTYLRVSELSKSTFDGLVITGAPLDQIPVTQVDFWEELKVFMKWQQTHVHRRMYICWGAYAAGIINNEFNVNLYQEKIFGEYFDGKYFMPHSRYFSIPIESVNENILVAGRKDIGATIIQNTNDHSLYITGHLEYEEDTLYLEYIRDKNKGIDIRLPEKDRNGINKKSGWRDQRAKVLEEWLHDGKL